MGYLNLVYLYPKFLELSQVGLLRTIQDAAILLVPIASLGFPQVISRYYPRYASEARRYSSFIGLLLIGAAAGFIVVALVFSGGKEFLFSSFQEKAPEVMEHTGLILLMVLLLSYFGIFEQIARAQVRISTPAFLREVGVRLLQAVILGMYVIDWISFDQFLLLSVLLYAGLVIFLIFYLNIPAAKPELPNKQITSLEFKEIFLFGAISFISGGSSLIISKIDSLMVSGMVGLEAAAIYTTTFYMATVIEVPKRAMTTSATAILSIAFEKSDIKNCERVYRQTALNQMIIGGLLLIGLWANISNIFAIMPKGDLYEAGANVILIIGLTRLIDMSFGPSSEIIGLSRFYWFNLAVISSLAVSSILLNLFLIPRYGITGAATGTLISIFTFNLIKFIFIATKLKIQPFSRGTLKTLLVIILTVAVISFLPPMKNVWLDILIRSSVATLLYGALILGWNCSPEVNTQFSKLLKIAGIKK